MRNMSFSLTTEAYRNHSKTVTRRLGWAFLKPGDVVMAVEKQQGIPKGGHVIRMHPFEVISNIAEPLNDIVKRPRRDGVDETAREGFPGLLSWQFVSMFCRHNHCDTCAVVHRIEFRHLDAEDLQSCP